MTEPIRVPVTAPGATEAAAQVRTFAGTVAQSGAAAEKATAAHAGVAKAIQAEGASAEGAAVKNKAHIRTLDEEIIRLKKLEEQSLITAAARKKLGESGNAADISAIRRFSRQLPGVGRELGRGVSEGVEGTEGTGLRAGLGMAGAGLAAGFVSFEVIQKVVEGELELAKREAEVREAIIKTLEESNKRMTDLGKGAVDKFGDAITSLAASGGESAISAAKKYAKDTNDVTGVDAYATASQRFGGGDGQSLALAAASAFSQSGGGSAKSAMDKLSVERIARAQSLGMGANALAGELYGDDHGVGRLTSSQIQRRILNRSGSETAAGIDAVTGANIDTSLAGLSYLPAALGGALSDKAKARDVASATLVDQNIANRGKDSVLNAEADAEHAQEGPGGFAPHIETALNFYRDWFADRGIGSGSAGYRRRERADEQFQTADALMPGANAAAEALESAAHALRGMGRSAQAQGATP